MIYTTYKQDNNNMPFSNFLNSNNPYLKLNEANFISNDILGLADSDAKFKMSELTIDKLFEGLDLEKSQSLCNLIGNNALSIKDNLNIDNSNTTFAFSLISDQIKYMQEKVYEIEKEFEKYYNYIVSAHKYKEGKEKESLLAQYTSPESISSVIPKIEELVSSAKRSGIDFKNERIRQAFEDLHEIKINSILSKLMSELKDSADNVGLKKLYMQIDSYSMETIESDSASTIPKTYITKLLDYKDMYESNDPLDRMAAFFEQAIMLYPFGYYLKRNFSENYFTIENSDLISASLKQFVPTMDYNAFENMSQLLYNIADIIVSRIYANNPDETNKNVFIPALQATWVSMLTLIALKLVNYNIEVEDVIVQKEDEKKAMVAKTIEERAKMAFESFKSLSGKGFFSAGTSLYKEGGQGMDSENIKLINNLLVSLNLLPNTKTDSTSFDSETKGAIFKMQTINKAKMVDGIIGPETRTIIEKTAQGIANKYNLS